VFVEVGAGGKGFQTRMLVMLVSGGGECIWIRGFVEFGGTQSRGLSTGGPSRDERSMSGMSNLGGFVEVV
jgi:hypothetical protein